MLDRSTDTFAKQLVLLRSCEGTAVREFIEKYEPFIRRTVRFRLGRSLLRPVADSVDVCQSVLGGFLLRLMAGDYQLRTEEDLRKLLVGIANKKFLMLQRRESATKRDRKQTMPLEKMAEPVCYRSSETQQQIEYDELMTEINKRLSSQELELLELRRKGVSWCEIATPRNEDAALLRKRLSRALRRVSSELGLDF